MLLHSNKLIYCLNIPPSLDIKAFLLVPHHTHCPSAHQHLLLGLVEEHHNMIPKMLSKLPELAETLPTFLSLRSFPLNLCSLIYNSKEKKKQ